MTINDFDITRPIEVPRETDPPWIIDADAVLPLTVTAQCLEMVTRQIHQRLQGVGGIQYPEAFFLRTACSRRIGLHPVSRRCSYLWLPGASISRKRTSTSQIAPAPRRTDSSFRRNDEQKLLYQGKMLKLTTLESDLLNMKTPPPCVAA